MLEQLKIFFHANSIPLCFYGIIGIFHVSWCYYLRSYQEDDGVTKKDYEKITKAMKVMGDQVSSMMEKQELHRQRQTDYRQLFEPMSVSSLQDMNENRIETMRLDFKTTCDDLISQLTAFHAAGYEKLIKDEEKGKHKLLEVEQELRDLKKAAEKYEDMFEKIQTQLEVVKKRVMDSCESMEMRCDAALKKANDVQGKVLDGRCEDVRFTLANETVAIRREVHALYEKYNNYCDYTVRTAKEGIVKKVQLENEELCNSLKDEFISIHKYNMAISNAFTDTIIGIKKEQRDFVKKFANRLVYADSDDESAPSKGAGNPNATKPVVFLWRIKNFKDTLNRLKEGSRLDLIPTEPWNFGNGLFVEPRILVDETDTILLIRLDFNKEGGLGDKVSPIAAFLHTRRYTLLDRSGSDERNDVEFVDVASFKRNSPIQTLTPAFANTKLCEIKYLEDNERFVKDDEAILKIVLEPISYQTKSIRSMNGVLVWKIDNYTQKKQKEIDGGKFFLMSPVFSNSLNGYNMQMDLFLNGDERFKGEYLSIYLQIILGQFDDRLPESFKCKITFILVDQTGGTDLKSVKDCHTFKGDEMYFGFPDFVSQAMAEDPKYLKDDTIIIKTVVEMLEPDGVTISADLKRISADYDD